MTTEIQTQNIILYSAKTIQIATFLGGPLAAGYLIGENFKALKEPKEAQYSLIIGIVVTLLLFGGLFMLPESIVDKIPGQLIPLIYMAIIWAIIESTQGDRLKAHKENDYAFFSGWRAAGIGLISLVILVLGILGITYFGLDNEVYEAYDREITVFQQNETASLAFYDHIDTKTPTALVKELETITIPAWEKNVALIKKSHATKDLPSELLEQNKLLLRYAELRIEAFKLFKKTFEEDTDAYSWQLDKIHKEIDAHLKLLN